MKTFSFILIVLISMNLYAEQYACSYLYNGEKREILLERGLTEESKVMIKFSFPFFCFRVV